MIRSLRVAVCGLLGAALLPLSGCGSGGQIAAIVNGQVITVEDVEQRMAKLSEPARRAFGDDKSRLLEEMVMETVLLQEAQRRRLHRDEEVQRLLTEARRQVLLGRLLEVLRQEQPVEVAEEEITAFYKENPERFKQPETYRASHILVNEEKTAQEALRRIQGGEPFARVAQELSIDPTRARGGDIGFFQRGQLVPEFEEAALRLKAGQLSDVVKTPLGWHVILLTEHRSERVRPLEEVRDDIRELLVRQKRQRHVESVIQRLRSEAKIDVRQSAFEPAKATGLAEPGAAASAGADQPAAIPGPASDSDRKPAAPTGS